MRKYIFTIVFMLLGLTTSFAQKVSVPEPEFADQTYLLTCLLLTRSTRNYHESLVLLKQKLVHRYILLVLEK